MSELERKLLAKMTSQEGISRVWDCGLRPDVFEDPINRFVFEFMTSYWLDAKMKHPPTWVVMEAEYPTVPLVDDEDVTVDWLISWLQRRYSARQAQDLIRSAAKTANEDPVSTLETLWQSAYDAAQVNAPRYSRADVVGNIDERRQRYLHDVEGRAMVGVPLGMEQIDDHTRGLLPGELAAVAAYTKTGKSWLLAQVFTNALRQGLRPIFFTLEMSIGEIADRVDALYSGVSYRALSQRSLLPDQMIRLHRAQDEMAEMGVTGMFERPQRGDRTVKHMVSRARQVEADVMLIDQLSFIDAERNYTGDSALRMKHGDITFELKDEISRESAGKLPCYLAVQLNRQAGANAGGRGSLFNFANSSMVEQTVDLAIGLWRNEEMRHNHAMGLDIMPSRRCAPRSWTLGWHLDERTEITVREEFVESGERL